jgi:predicted PurR-regulated permease PerM
MSAGDVAAVVVAVLTTVAFVLLVLTLVSLHRAVRDLRQVLRQLRDEAVPAAQELRATVRQANAELDRVDDLLGSAETVAGTVESASDLTYRAMSRPLIRMMSLGTGLGEGVRGYRRRRREKGTT